MSPQTTSVKPPINRKMALYIVAGIGAIILIAMLILMAGSNPEAKRAAAAQKAQQEAIAKLQAGSQQAGEQVVRAHTPATFDSSTLFNTPLGAKPPEKPATASTSNLPPVNPTTLAELDQAFRASQKPGGGAGLSPGGVPSFSSVNSQGGAGQGTSGTYEDFPKQSPALPQNDKQLVGMEPVGGASAQTYPATTPLSAPARRILEQGTLIRAVLDTKIDTRNPGNVVATVTQNVYDSLDQSNLLVPKGTRLIGSYGGNVSAGTPRIPVSFRRLELPDGRAVDLGNTPAINYAGATGIDGDYHSNILRALGPSLVVALIGTGVERLEHKGQSNDVQSTPYGTVVQSPSIAQQMAPQVNQEVMGRYGTAVPYFVIDAGTQFKLMVQKDIVIPSITQPEQRAGSGNVASNPQAGAWEAGAQNP